MVYKGSLRLGMNHATLALPWSTGHLCNALGVAAGSITASQSLYSQKSTSSVSRVMLTATGRYKRPLRIDDRATQATLASSRTAGKCCFLLAPGTGPEVSALGQAVSHELPCQLAESGICESFSVGRRESQSRA